MVSLSLVALLALLMLSIMLPPVTTLPGGQGSATMLSVSIAGTGINKRIWVIFDCSVLG